MYKGKNRMKRIVIIAAAALAIQGCAGGMASKGDADYVTNASDIVKNTDWSTMKTVVIDMNEFAYSPDDLQFDKDQPYKLVLRNSGEKKHYFTAPEFYKAIATRKVQSNKDGEIKAPYFTAIELMKGENKPELEIYFVPVKVGSYPVYCTIDDHREQGMEGTLVIR